MAPQSNQVLLSVFPVTAVQLIKTAKPQQIDKINWGMGNIDNNTWLLWGATIAWTLGFDTVYAMSDKEDDLKVGINSSAIFFGKYTAEAVGIFFIITAALMAALAFRLQLQLIFWLGWIIALVGWILQYQKIRKPHLPRSVYGKVFSQNVWLGFILLAGMVFG